MKKFEILLDDYLRYCKTIKNLDIKTLKTNYIDLTQFSNFVLTYSNWIDKTVLNNYISSLHGKY